jgi:hypothetical protein
MIKRNELIFKFNGGNGAILCNNCGKIILTGKQIPERFWKVATGESGETYKDIGPQFCCDKCEDEFYNE